MGRPRLSNFSRLPEWGFSKEAVLANRNTLSVVRVSLSTGALSDEERVALVAGIQKVAPTSTLMKVPSIASIVTSLGQQSTALQAAAATLAQDRRQVTLQTLVTQNATSAQDVAGMGLTALETSRPATGTPAVPGPIVVIPGKQSGYARVGVGVKGKLPYLTVAESAPDPIGARTTWSLLPGAGKQRKLTGPSGSRIGVRFAAVRLREMSGWSTPVLVILP